MGRDPRRRRHAALHGGAIGALLLIAAAIGCASDPEPTPRMLLLEGVARTERSVRDVVADPDRRDHALAIVERFAAIEGAFLDDAEALRSRIATLHADHGAGRADYEPVLAELDATRRRFVDEVVDSWRALSDVLRPEERRALAAVQLAEEERWRATLGR